jgi:hypothetical protein
MHSTKATLAQATLPIAVAVVPKAAPAAPVHAVPAGAATPLAPVPALRAVPSAPVRTDGEQQPSRPAPAIPVSALPHRTPAELLVLARRGLDEALQTRPDGLRYAAAHLAALRAAAAMLAARARPAPGGRRGRLTSVWDLLVLVAPEFDEWASFFAVGASKRAAAEAGIPRVVSAREADDLLRAAEQFVALVEISLGLGAAGHQPPLDGLVA